MDTIVAVSTPPGRGGIGVVRVSGPRADQIAAAVVRRVPEPRVATCARFRGADGESLDTGLAIWFPGPRSYTGEDTLELHGHGGPMVMDQVANRILNLGARLAEPGEFTQRAFLNGKLDLAQAEAVADLIDAATHEAARLAQRSLAGALSQGIGAPLRELVRIRVHVEGGLDFPDEDVPETSGEELGATIERIRTELATLRRTAARGNLLREGFAIVIVGRPNVGKSSLLNRLMGRERAIVTAIPGTTRDTLDELIHIDGLPIRIVDTAGVHTTTDPAELAGIARTWGAIDGADAVLVVVDDRAVDDEEDSAILARLPDSLPRVIIRNKIDLTGSPPGKVRGSKETSVALSAKTGEGVEKLCECLKRLAGYTPGAEGVFMARRRHITTLDEALAALGAAGRSAREGVGGELVAEDLRLAHRTLGQLTGEFTSDDLLGEIFSAFCIGK